MKSPETKRWGEGPDQGGKAAQINGTAQSKKGGLAKFSSSRKKLGDVRGTRAKEREGWGGELGGIAILGARRLESSAPFAAERSRGRSENLKKEREIWGREETSINAPLLRNKPAHLREHHTKLTRDRVQKNPLKNSCGKGTLKGPSPAGRREGCNSVGKGGPDSRTCDRRMSMSRNTTHRRPQEERR